MNHFRQRGFPVRPAWPADQAPGLFVAYLGLFESRGDFLWENFSAMYCLHVIRKGAGVFAADGRQYEARAGSVFMFFPGMHITYYDAPKTPWHYHWLRFAGRDAAWAFARIGFSPESPFRDLTGNQQFFSRLDQFAEVFRDGRYDDLYPITAAWDLLTTLGETRTSRRADPTELAEACRLVLENQLAAAPSVEDLANRFGVNRSTLFRAFKEAFHMAPKEYIDLLRFEKACGLLQRTDQSIKQIAAACGFRSQDYFCAAFRRRFQVPPGSWRRRLTTTPGDSAQHLGD